MNIEKAKALVEKKINELRKKTPVIEYDCKKLAEVEINKFFYGGRMIDRVMIVLRSNGCEHYKKTGGCSMCSHFNGTPINGVVTTENYIKQWDSIIDGSQFETYVDFNLNDYPVVCIYNLGSFFNENEISKEAARYIFSTLNNYKNVEKAIVESRAEYVTDDAISNIKSVYDNIIEIGIGVESTNMTIRELCHHKGIEDMSIYKKTVDTLHVHGCKALAYVNLKPVFLTEQEAIDDAVKTCIDCIDMGFDAISIEPTSLQNYSLANYMFELGVYRVPWLWSIREIIDQIYEKMETFYRILRDKHPRTPIIFIEDPVFTHALFDKKIAIEINKKNKAVNSVFKSLKTKGEKNIYIISSEKMLGEDGEATVDGIHFTDLGMMRYADLVCPVIKKVLKK
jgi:radical SAM enzyme (TIGR01210 family)